MKFRDFLIENASTLHMQNLVYTLHSRRTRFPLAVALAAMSPAQLASRIDHKISNAGESLGVRAVKIDPHTSNARPRILAIFTGQGAQWAGMGAEIISHSRSARKVIQSLQEALQSLPVNDRPSWSLLEELQKDPAVSGVAQAALSQPLCTAIQILLVDILRSANVELCAAVGHSSGEIAAAYAAGVISSKDAIRISYYRGLYAKLAQKGAMMAVGTSLQDIEALLQEPEYYDRVWVAATNSSSSVTLSGDVETLEEIGALLQDEGKFARMLKVDTAYHSRNMLPCSGPYLDALKRLDICVESATRCAWYSSVCDDNMEDISERLRGPYWNSNMLNPVRFKQAVERAIEHQRTRPFTMAIEIGPHPALKSPVLQITKDMTGDSIEYAGLLRRNVNDIEALASGLGSVATYLGSGSVDFHAFDKFITDMGKFQLSENLPTYSWNHGEEFWHESRYARAVRMRGDSVHELLGHQTPDSTEFEMRWRHIVRPKEIPWLAGHQLQNQIVFPAAGYVITALEACMLMLGPATASLIEVLDLEIRQALAFDDENSSVEVMFSLIDIRREKSHIVAGFSYNSATTSDKSSDKLKPLATGRVRIELGIPSPTVLPVRNPRLPNLIPLKAETFYQSLAKIEYQYRGPFYALSDLERKLGAATGFISNVDASAFLLRVHPAVLDAAFQALILAVAAPDDGTLWSMHVPTKIQRVVVNPEICRKGQPATARLPFDATSQSHSSTYYGSVFSGDVYVFCGGTEHAVIQVEGLECTPFSPASANDDKILFASTIWAPTVPDTPTIGPDEYATQERYRLSHLLERVALYFLRKLQSEVPPNHCSRHEGPYVNFFNFAASRLEESERFRKDGSPEWTFWQSDWDHDDMKSIQEVCRVNSKVVDFRLLEAVGWRLPDIIMNNMPAVEVGMNDHLLTDFYREGLGMPEYLSYVAKTVKKIVDITPRINCLEIGAGTGSATKAIMKMVDFEAAFSSYTFTDVSTGFFELAQSEFQSQARNMLFKTLDISRDPSNQGYEPYSFDLIVASMVLHATPSIQETLHHVRKLMRPGGRLIVLEVREDAPARIGTIFGAFEGWWLGAEEGRRLSPCISLVKWDELLRSAGFSGCDSTTIDSDPMARPCSLFVSQAVDDRVTFLRKPLVHKAVPEISRLGKIFPHLVILGGETLQTARIVADLEVIVSQYSDNISSAKTISALHHAHITSQTTVLSLLDVDQPFFKTLTESKWTGLKAIFQEVGSVLWVTKGRRANEPHNCMTLGLMRCGINELPGLSVQFLDFEDSSSIDAYTIGEALIRFKAVSIWEKEDCTQPRPNIHVEREVVVGDKGQMYVPRLVANRAMNSRYNSSRRRMLEAADITDGNDNVSIVASKQGHFLRAGPRQELLNGEFLSTSYPSMRVRQSIISPIPAAGNSLLFLSLATCQRSFQSMVALSTSNSMIVTPAIAMTLPSKISSEHESEFLYRISLYLLVCDITKGLDAGDRIWIHEPDAALIQALSAEAAARSLHTTFTRSNGDAQSRCIPIHPHASRRDLLSFPLAETNVFVNCSASDVNARLAERIATFLPKSCHRRALHLDHKPRAPLHVQLTVLQTQLQNAVQGALKDLKAPVSAVQIVKLGDLSNDNCVIPSHAIVDWSDDRQLLTRVQPVDHQPLFSGSKTYWLVGLSGSLGLSLCEWMVRHGAKYIVISSRRPHVADAWSRQMMGLGAVIKIIAWYVTRFMPIVISVAKISTSVI